MSEMTIGEMPMVTSLVGASAAPSHAPAANPERMPRNCNCFERERSRAAVEISGGAADGILLRSEISESIAEAAVRKTKRQQAPKNECR
jgi:hypothetical protein